MSADLFAYLFYLNFYAQDLDSYYIRN